MGQLACLVLALPAAAAEFTPPAGCTLTMTVQQRSCTVAQHYSCSADAAGDQWVAYFTREGLVYQSRIDAETRWMESTDTVSGITDRLEPDAADHASLRTLMASGRDDFDFWTVSDSGERLRHVGHDRLTGTTVIDGMALDTTRFELETFSAEGDLLIRRTGTQFVSRETGRFYGGLETATDWSGEVSETNDTPVTFARPGEAGFGSTDPQFDCDMQMVGRITGGGA
ncbi:hypothetical protein [Paracoccus sphaerophysae]|uniref:hypothetical protein n=1 Tax=Paracoccus sphaerophysae TaxID=690417 RepID=UPI0023522430|nr:hypothetical protein [Paracoccus sphaerophysae]